MVPTNHGCDTRHAFRIAEDVYAAVRVLVAWVSSRLLAVQERDTFEP